MQIHSVFVSGPAHSLEVAGSRYAAGDGQGRLTVDIDLNVLLDIDSWPLDDLNHNQYLTYRFCDRISWFAGIGRNQKINKKGQRETCHCLMDTLVLYYSFKWVPNQPFLYSCRQSFALSTSTSQIFKFTPAVARFNSAVSSQFHTCNCTKVIEVSHHTGAQDQKRVKKNKVSHSLYSNDPNHHPLTRKYLGNHGGLETCMPNSCTQCLLWSFAPSSSLVPHVVTECLVLVGPKTPRSKKC